MTRQCWGWKMDGPRLVPCASDAADGSNLCAEHNPDQFSILRSLVEGGEFHHATYRCIGTVWEGLHFYRKSATGFRGYEHAGCVRKGDPNLDAAHDLVAHTGISVGAYGHG